MSIVTYVFYMCFITGCSDIRVLNVFYNGVLRSIFSGVTDLNDQVKLLGSLLAAGLHACGH